MWQKGLLFMDRDTMDRSGIHQSKSMLHCWNGAALEQCQFIDPDDLSFNFTHI